MIVAESLRKHHAGRAILDGLGFAVEPGEVVAVIGPSGSGKTTLLRCLNGLDSFDGGSLIIAGERLQPGKLGDAGARSRLRRRVGFVFQQYHLFPHRTALGNVAGGPR